MAEDVPSILKRAQDEVDARKKKRQNVGLDVMGPSALDELVNEVRLLRGELEAMRYVVTAGIVAPKARSAAKKPSPPKR
jgi:hypothetical protein